MSRDNWERMVAAVVKREQIWQLCHNHSRSPSISTISSDSSEPILDSSGTGVNLNSVFPPPQGTLSTSSFFQGQQTMTSTDVQNVTHPLYEIKIGRKAETRKQSRLWSWEAFWKRANPSRGSGLSLSKPQLFTLKQIKAATFNFDPANKIGEAESGSIYKGLFSGGTIAAVKNFLPKSTRAFVTEIGVLSSLKHPNLIKLYGYCMEGNHLLVIYEFMENHSVSHALFGSDTTVKQKLDWPARKRICLGIARGLAYVHKESTPTIIHRDINTSNVLLDKDLNAKISEFGKAKLNKNDEIRISTHFIRNMSHKAPEYALHGYMSTKADVYSYGVVALEVISGKSNASYSLKKDGSISIYLLDRAHVLQENGGLLELVDPELGSEYSSEEAMLLLNVALLCTTISSASRPKMSQVVTMLERGLG